MNIFPHDVGDDNSGQGPFQPELRRRSVINVAAVSFASIGGAMTIIPLVDSMEPSADVLAVSTTEVDISGIAVGTAIVAVFQSQPLFVRHLSPREIAEANAVPMSTLRDPQTLAQRTKPGKAEWLITMGVCTHLGCIPLGARRGEVKGEYGGYFCPCHGSVYDTAGRIRKGPAPRNLDVPDYKFLNSNSIFVGQK